jgi:hypothetical protein
VELIQDYYKDLPGDNKKSAEEAEALARRHSRGFAQLVARLERKYLIPVRKETTRDEL